MNVEQVHTKMKKSHLIRTYRQWLLDNKKFNKSRKYGKLKQPIINGRRYSWSEFSRLPKDAILVHMISNECDMKYMDKLNQEGFYVESRKWRHDFGVNLFDGGEEE